MKLWAKAAIAALVSAAGLAIGTALLRSRKDDGGADTPPPPKIPVAPRAGGKPSPTATPASQVPPSVANSAASYTPVDPPMNGAHEVSYEPEGSWERYGWYTYKGNAPEKMWIRVDISRDGRFQPYTTSSSERIETYLPATWRWTVVMGDAGIPMARGVNDNEIAIVCEEGDPCFEDMKNMPIYSPGGIAPVHAAFDARVRREWTDPSAALLVARAAADWIDVAYGGGS